MEQRWNGPGDVQVGVFGQTKDQKGLARFGFFSQKEVTFWSRNKKIYTTKHGKMRKEEE